MQGLNWAIVLAGGEGTRVRSFLQQFCGGQGLKQFSAVIGTRSMIQHTLDRLQRLIPPDRILIVVASHHRAEVGIQLAHWPEDNIIYQPANRDTAPGILLPLAHVTHRDPLAKVAVFPSDHFVWDEAKFTAYIRMAFKEIDQQPRALVLLGMTPTEGEESEYGYIQLGKIQGKLRSIPIEAFFEKPSAEVATRLIREGALWNTMIFAARAWTIWHHIREAAPVLFKKFSSFHRVENLYGPHCLDNYKTIPAVNFSSDICQPLARKLRVLPVPDVGWSDWGTTSSITRSLRKLGRYEEFRRRLEEKRVDPSLYMPAMRSAATAAPQGGHPSMPANNDR